MASNSTGKWVARAASTGGGRTYRGQMPVNWYASLAVICIVGLLLIGYSRYERVHPPTPASSGPPTSTDTWHAALAFDICGTVLPNLPSNTGKATTGFTTDGTGVVTIAPRTSSETGANATLGKFVSGYKGLTLTSTSVRYPGKSLMSNGQTCPSGTPDAGKQGFVIVDTWPSFTSKKSTEASGDPTTLKFGNGQMITVGFVPATTALPKPPAQTITSLISAVSGTSSTTPTTAAPTTPTTAATTPTTAAPTTPTTAKSTGGTTK